MPIEFRCSQCDQSLRVPDTAAGKAARCPKCQALMTVPAGRETGFAALPALSTRPAVATPAAPASDAATERSLESSRPAENNPFANEEAFKTTLEKPSGNPFADTAGGAKLEGPATASLNPYISPAGAGSYLLLRGASGLRPGLPWEIERQTIGCWFRTAGIILGSPTAAFNIMRREGGLGTPMLYGVYGLGLPACAAMLLIAPFILLVALAGNRGDVLPMLGGMLVFTILIMALVAFYVLMCASVGAMFSAAMYHVLLLMVGGGERGYEATFRVVSYTQGSLSWLMVIPYIGPMVMGIWSIVLLIIGLSQAHDISAGRAALAIFLPAIVCFGFIAILLVAVIGIALFSNR